MYENVLDSRKVCCHRLLVASEPESKVSEVAVCGTTVLTNCDVLEIEARSCNLPDHVLATKWVWLPKRASRIVLPFSIHNIPKLVDPRF